MSKPRKHARCHPEKPNHCHNYCYECYHRQYRNHRDPEATRAYNKQWRMNNKHRLREYFLKNRYGLTLDQWNEMLIAQGGHCQFCESTKLDVDHCHKTGRVRGLLCRRHNTLVGFLESYSADDIELAKGYLCN